MGALWVYWRLFQLQLLSLTKINHIVTDRWGRLYGLTGDSNIYDDGPAKLNALHSHTVKYATQGENMILPFPTVQMFLQWSIYEG